jgi:hypothetical protein
MLKCRGGIYSVKDYFACTLFADNNPLLRIKLCMRIFLKSIYTITHHYN